MNVVVLNVPCPKKYCSHHKGYNLLWLSFAAFFIIGWFLSSVYASFNIELSKISISNLFLDSTYPNTNQEHTSSFLSNEKPTPKDRIDNYNIQIDNDSVKLNIGERPRVSRFTDTHSMDPVLSSYANAVEVIPKDPHDIKIGDIISYETSEGVIIHRVVNKGIDKKGVYYITKGDNNPIRDFEKVRFYQIKGVVLAIVY